MSSESKPSVTELLSRLDAATEAEVAELERAYGIGSRWVVTSLGDVAAFLGVELQTVKEWRVGPVRMPGEEGCWDLSAITQWRCERLKANAVNAKSVEQIELANRLSAAEVGLKELRLAQARGELVGRDEAIAKLWDMYNQCRVQLEAIPGIIGGVIPPEIRADVVHEIEQQIRLICRQMASQAA